MIDIEELELEFKTFFGDKENEHTLLARMFPLIAEVKRLKAKLFEAELWVNNDSYTFENSIKELNDYLESEEE